MIWKNASEVPKEDGYYLCRFEQTVYRVCKVDVDEDNYCWSFGNCSHLQFVAWIDPADIDEVKIVEGFLSRVAEIATELNTQTLNGTLDLTTKATDSPEEGLRKTTLYGSIALANSHIAQRQALEELRNNNTNQQDLK